MKNLRSGPNVGLVFKRKMLWQRVLAAPSLTTGLTEVKKRKKPRSGTNSTGSAGTGSSAGTLVAEGEMYSPATHCNSLKSDMSVTFFSERCEPNVGFVLKNVATETSGSPVALPTITEISEFVMPHSLRALVDKYLQIILPWHLT